MDHGSTEILMDFMVKSIPDSISGFQKYYEKMAKLREYGTESPRDTLLLMLEEQGELARAVRKDSGLFRDRPASNSVKEEAADILIYLMHFANVSKFDLFEAVREKEAINHQRCLDRRAQEKV